MRPPARMRVITVYRIRKLIFFPQDTAPKGFLSRKNQWKSLVVNK
jgi:hypothetical protein